ncbi:MAG: hypothetical protein EBW04_06415 [Betaproteobacteria bacterium]|nr:hypothetical protein [Betaproteobacteria bacterium]
MVEDSSRLSEEELSALASDDGFDEDLGTLLDPSDVSSASVRPHNLVTEDTTIGINLAAVDMITERFTRHVRLGLLEVLRTSPKINPTKVQVVKFGDYLRELKAPLSVNVVRMNPLRGFSTILIDPSVIFSSLDSFFAMESFLQNPFVQLFF